MGVAPLVRGADGAARRPYLVWARAAIRLFAKRSQVGVDFTGVMKPNEQNEQNEKQRNQTTFRGRNMNWNFEDEDGLGRKRTEWDSILFVEELFAAGWRAAQNAVAPGIPRSLIVEGSQPL